MQRALRPKPVVAAIHGTALGGGTGVDMVALAGNLAAVRELIGPRIELNAVVKADAYGHGLVPVGRVANFYVCLAVPAMIFMAASTSLALRSGIFFSAISLS